VLPKLSGRPREKIPNFDLAPDSGPANLDPSVLEAYQAPTKVLTSTKHDNHEREPLGAAGNVPNRSFAFFFFFFFHLTHPIWSHIHA
jgi:hypothetical protein